MCPASGLSNAILGAINGSLAEFVHVPSGQLMAALNRLRNPDLWTDDVVCNSCCKGGRSVYAVVLVNCGVEYKFSCWSNVLFPNDQFESDVLTSVSI